MDLKINHLIIEKDRPGHISKHGVSIKEVIEVISGDYIFIKSKEGRWLLTGKTRKGRYLTIVVGKRQQMNVYGLVTARPSSKEERSFYEEFIYQIGGEENGKDKTN